MPPPYEGGAPDGPKVVVIGDSLVDFGSSAIKPALQGRGWPVSLHGEPSVNTRSSQMRINGASAAEPNAVVIITTANDAFDLYRGAQSLQDVSIALDTALSSVDNLGCQVWMLIDEHAWFYGFPQWGPVVNQMVIDRAAAHPNVRLLDWRHEVVNHPDWFEADLFHHTDAGNAAFAARLADTIATCPGF
jgi:hypothetical protein